MRLAFKSVEFKLSRLTLLCGWASSDQMKVLIEKDQPPQARKNSASDCLWTQIAISSRVSRLQAYPEDFGLAKPPNHVSQFLKINLFLSNSLSLSLSLSSFQQENRYHYGPEKDPAAWCFNLIQVLIFPIHFYMGAISLLRILRTSENINFTQKTRRRHWGQIEDSDKRTRRVACPL